MDVSAILSSIDAELARLQQARNLLAGPAATVKRRGRPKNSEILLAATKAAKNVSKKRTMSPEGRARVAAAQKARWAAAKNGGKK